MFEESACLSSPDCEKWSECTMSEKFCRKFVRHHTGPVLQEETLSGKNVQTFSDSSYCNPELRLGFYCSVEKRRVQSEVCSLTSVVFLYQYKKVQENHCIWSTLSQSMKWWFYQSCSLLKLSNQLNSRHWYADFMISKTKSTEQRIMVAFDQDCTFSKVIIGSKEN